MTRLHRVTVASLTRGDRLGLYASARILRDVSGERATGLAALPAVEIADDIAASYRQLTGRSVHTDEEAVLVVERDRRGRVTKFEIEGVAA